MNKQINKSWTLSLKMGKSSTWAKRRIRGGQPGHWNETWVCATLTEAPYTQGGPRHAAAMIFPGGRLDLKFYLLEAFGGRDLFVFCFLFFFNLNILTFGEEHIILKQNVNSEVLLSSPFSHFIEHQNSSARGWISNASSTTLGTSQRLRALRVREPSVQTDSYSLW